MRVRNMKSFPFKVRMRGRTFSFSSSAFFASSFSFSSAPPLLLLHLCPLLLLLLLLLFLLFFLLIKYWLRCTRIFSFIFSESIYACATRLFSSSYFAYAIHGSKVVYSVRVLRKRSNVKSNVIFFHYFTLPIIFFLFFKVHHARKNFRKTLTFLVVGDV